MRVQIQSLKTANGAVTIQRPHLFLGGVKDGIFYPPSDILGADVRALEIYIDDTSAVDVDLIADLDFRDANSAYNLVPANIGALDSVVFLALKSTLA